MRYCLLSIIIMFVSIITFLFICWFFQYGSISINDLPGIYISKRNSNDSVFIVLVNERSLYYKRTLNNIAHFGRVQFDEDNYSLILYSWKLTLDKIEKRYINDIYEEYDDPTYNGEVKRNFNCICVEFNLTDPNGDEIKGYGYRKISDNIPIHHKVSIEKYILDN